MLSKAILFVILVCLQCTSISCTVTCGSNCTSDATCQSYLGNPCTFCYEGICTPMCGVGCSTSADCVGGGNPCTQCSDKRTCVNPVPQCGSFCGGYDGACRFNGGSTCGGINEDCCYCHSNITIGCTNSTSTSACGSACSSNSQCSANGSGCNYCINSKCVSQNPPCGTICTASGECTTNPSCPQCVGYYCSPAASCGQNCLTSGQCSNNPGTCKACIGTLCTNYIPCGGSCGSSDWCNPHSTCPVCSRTAKCASSFEHENWLETATPEEIIEWETAKQKVITEATASTLEKYKSIFEDK